jgi:Derlin-2/3
MLVIYMKYNEDFDFKGRLADLVWMLVMIVAFLHLVGCVLGFPWAGLTMPLCWVFCKRHPTMQMKLYFFVFSANIFPWVLCAFHVVTGGSLALDLAGIVAGHAYLFLADVLPKTHGKELATTPQFLLRWFPRQNQALAGVHMPTRMRAEQQAAAAQPPRHNWGAGRVLGAQ